MSVRIGFGYDVHRLVQGRTLVLAGVKVPYEYGLEGHSDADVLTHAVIDALLGALGKGDIGKHFPDTDPAYKDAVSLSMLVEVVAWAAEDDLRLNNLDATVVAEEPKLLGYLDEMSENLADAFRSSKDRINIKATTSERLGPFGRGEGLEAFAVVSLVKGDVVEWH